MNQMLILLVAVAILIYFQANKQRSEITHTMDALKKSGGWIEISNQQYKPLFQGWLYTITGDSYGVALGVLLEENIIPTLIRDLHKTRKVEYLEERQILAKVLIDFENKVVLSKLVDTKLQDSLKPIIESKKNIDVILEIDSTGITFVDKVENMETFFSVWNNAK